MLDNVAHLCVGSTRASDPLRGGAKNGNPQHCCPSSFSQVCRNLYFLKNENLFKIMCQDLRL